MEIFAAAMREQGVDAEGITARGLAGSTALPGVVRLLNRELP
jgi:hypothetical protein